MVKSDRDHAIRLLEMASRDAIALDNMLDRKRFAEEVFGFHYEGYDEGDEPLDRGSAAVRIHDLLSHVRKRITGKTA